MEALVQADIQEEPFGIFINEIILHNGQKILLKENETIVIVGSNNAGKSVFLRSLIPKIISPVNESIIIKELDYKILGTKSTYIDWIKKRSVIFSNGGLNVYNFQGGSYNRLEDISDRWENLKQSINAIIQSLYSFLTTEERLNASKAIANIDYARQSSIQPLHVLYTNSKIEKNISKIFKNAFGKNLILNRVGGQNTELYIEDQANFPSLSDENISAYLEAFSKLSPLVNQGDGMKSFVGILLYLFTLDKSLIIIDEPEAFLHPPQAKLLGQVFTRDEIKSGQKFVATHSSDFLNGIIENNLEHIRIMRIKRVGDINQISQLGYETIKSLWNNPILKYSNALDGLFHEKVIVCESDADCQFYNAIKEALLALDENLSNPDVLFTHCGGKDRVSVITGALKTLDVDVCTIVDFDFLKESDAVKNVVVSLKGGWSEIEKDLKIVQDSINQKKPQLNSKEVKDKIQQFLNGISETPEFPKSTSSQIKEVLKESSSWGMAKISGKAYVPAGTPHQTYIRLIHKLNSLGIYIVEVGEIEGFCREIGGHGPAWVNAVLENKDIKNDPIFVAAREFVKKILFPITEANPSQ